MATTYDDILAGDDDKINHGGTQITIYYAPSKDIATDSVKKTSPSTPEDYFTLGTAPVMKATKKFLKLDVAMTTGELNIESIGEGEGKAFKLSPTFQIVGNQGSALPLFNSPNGRFVFFIPLNNGKTIQVGTVKQPAGITPVWGSGQTSGNGSFFTFTVDAYAAQVFFYDASIPLTPPA